MIDCKTVKRRIEVLAAAASEAEAAAVRYEAQRAGLGRDFRDEFERVLELLRESIVPGRPWPGRLGERGVKRILFRRFPFSVAYVLADKRSVILAVAHHRRRPEYWRDRLPKAT
jgi:toxin ParE1/3/4